MREPRQISRRTTFATLERLLSDSHLTILTVDEVADLARLYGAYPQGIPEDVTMLFVREGVVRRVLHATPQSRAEERGFASMDPARLLDIARQGGRAQHEKGAAYKWGQEEAAAAGLASQAAQRVRRSVSAALATEQR